MITIHLVSIVSAILLTIAKLLREYRRGGLFTEDYFIAACLFIGTIVVGETLFKILPQIHIV